MPDGMKNSYTRLRARFSLRAALDNPLFSELIGYALLAASVLPFRLKRRLELRLGAARRLQGSFSRAMLASLLRKWTLPEHQETWRSEQIGWQRYFGSFGNIGSDSELTTSLLLKEPGDGGEKGVVYCSFEFNWMKLLAAPDARRFFSDYLLVGASSWSPPDHAAFASLQGMSDDPAFIGISNAADIAPYSMWEPSIYPLPIMASDWIDPDMYRPLPANERTTDILMVSHFSQWKRHWLLFEALRDMPRNLRVVLIGRDAPGRTEADLRREARAFGVHQELDIRKKLEIDEVSVEQSKARLTLAFSKREGSCVSVAESLFADTPVAMMSDAHIGSRAYINSATGRLVRRRRLSAQLESMLEEGASFSPREWALANITAKDTSVRLNDILRDHCTRQGKPWTRDIAPMCWRYVPRYLDAADKQRLSSGVERLRQTHGIGLKEFLSERQDTD